MHSLGRVFRINLCRKTVGILVAGFFAQFVRDVARNAEGKYEMKRITLLLAVFVLLCAGVASAGLFQNGSFEGLVLTGDALDDLLVVVHSPDTVTIPSWSINGPAGGSVDWVSDYLWHAQDGFASIDLSGTFGNLSSLYQEFDTVTGQTYEVSFWMAGNFLSTTDPKSMQVTVGDYSQGYTQDYAPMDVIDGVTQPAWTQKTFQFQATGSSSTLKFADTSGNDLEGVIVDNVTVTAVPEPSTLALLGVGAFGLLAYAWRRRAS
jgi:choice-of-anchor C domain-containing protein